MDNYPPGAANDPNAPYNQKDVTECDTCGNNAEDELVESYDRSEGETRWMCESCAGIVKCSTCHQWYPKEDTHDGVCVDCVDPDDLPVALTEDSTHD